MKSVCIIGAGPAGLAAAKTFLQTKQFDVTVYEKDSRIGGIWALDKHSIGGYLSPYTPTNLSRFTVGFSDLDWKSVDYGQKDQVGASNGVTKGVEPPMFPKAWMANRYLEVYRERYIPDSVIHCDYEVVRADRIGKKWTVSTKPSDGSVESRNFDYLIMASGFFARPRGIQQDVPQLAKSVKMVHSSRFRKLSELFEEDQNVQGKKILMLGGGNSSGETAAAVALQLSNSQWSPNTSEAGKYKGCRIVHVTPRPFYPLPHFIEYEEGSRSYIPLDFKLYDFAKRPESLGSYAGRQPMEVRNMVHNTLQTWVGGDQSDLSDALVSRRSDARGSVYVALSESYSEYVRSGMINVLSGRVTAIKQAESNVATATVTSSESEFDIDDIAAVIYATGYTPCPALDMLDADTKTAVEYDSNSMRLPMILEQWQTMSQQQPSISFLGFYEGPYWPMVEMQARLTAERWLSDRVATTRSYEESEELKKLRQSMHDRSKDVPQYWFSDHLGYMENIAGELGLERNDRDFSKREGLPSPARYLSQHNDHTEANAIIDELHETWHDCLVKGKYVARAAFRALHGQWKITRRIESSETTFPSGILDGTAHFCPRFPTADKNGKTFDLEYLYIESGTFAMSTGATTTASRRYVYRYCEADDTLSIWFVKPESSLEVDYLFHELEFVEPEDARKARACIAKANHLCAEDMYWTEYRLPLIGIKLMEFDIQHAVKGPSKDYVMNTRYERPER